MMKDNSNELCGLKHVLRYISLTLSLS